MGLRLVLTSARSADPADTPAHPSPRHRPGQRTPATAATAVAARCAMFDGIGSGCMGHVFAELELSNPRRTDFVPMRVNAMVDTGALMLCIPEHVARQLDLQTESVREVSVADGRTATVPYVGPVKVFLRQAVLLCRRAGDRRRGAAGVGSHGRHGLGREPWPPAVDDRPGQSQRPPRPRQAPWIMSHITLRDVPPELDTRVFEQLDDEIWKR